MIFYEDQTPHDVRKYVLYVVSHHLYCILSLYNIDNQARLDFFLAIATPGRRGMIQTLDICLPLSNINPLASTVVGK